METKICSKCGINKKLCEYQKNSHAKSGYRSECSECSKKNKKLIPKEKILNYNKIFREKNRDKLRKKQREYYLNNTDKEIERSKKRRTINKVIKQPKSEEEKKLTRQIWSEKNKKIINQKKRDKYKNNIIHRLSENLRNRLNSFLKANKLRKNNKTFDIVGCNPLFLKQYIETQFRDGMNWGNRNEWHIDHIIPLSSAKTEEKIYKLCHYTNLQPLWKNDNLKKGNKIL
jgi:hypothetical protein